MYGVIMAGGGGTRFWPLSRQAVPKQLLNLSGKGLMINETIERITQVIREEDVFIVTNAAQARTMEDVVVPGVRRDHILVEPAGRNTAACVGYAAMEIVKKYGDGVMCTLRRIIISDSRRCLRGFCARPFSVGGRGQAADHRYYPFLPLHRLRLYPL